MILYTDPGEYFRIKMLSVSWLKTFALTGKSGAFPEAQAPAALLSQSLVFPTSPDHSRSGLQAKDQGCGPVGSESPLAHNGVSGVLLGLVFDTFPQP